MTRIFFSAVMIAATLVTSGCANSVINDPEEMARRQAYVERQQEGWERVLGGLTSGAASTGNTGSDYRTGSGLYQPGVTASQCQRMGGTWNSGSGFCWKL